MQASSKGHKKNLSSHDMINGKEKNKVLLGKFIFMFWLKWNRLRSLETKSIFGETANSSDIWNMAKSPSYNHVLYDPLCVLRKC